MKDPDGVSSCIDDAVAKEVGGLGLEEEEREAVLTIRTEKMHEACSKWFEYGEYLTVEIDTDAGTATVVPR
jgi:hypothetical protein